MKQETSPFTGLYSLEERLSVCEARLRTLMEALPDLIAFFDEEGGLQSCNRAFSHSHGSSEALLRGAEESALLGSTIEDAAAADNGLDFVGVQRQQRWFEAADGSLRFLDTQRMSVNDARERARGTLIVSRDMTERRRLREQLAERERRLLVALQGASLGVWDWNILSGEMSFSPLFGDILGRRMQDLRPHVSTLEALVHEEDWPVIRRALEPHLRGETDSYRAEYRLRHERGHWVWILDAGRVLERDEQGRPLRAVGLHEDISARKHMEESLLHLATSDPLTGLWNRRHFTQMVKAELSHIRRHPLSAALIILDLDHFKRINDTYGHAIGDDVLRHFSGLVSQHLREVDVFARIGGEEFGVLLPGLEDSAGAMRAAERLRALLQAHPLPAADGPLAFTASMGVAMLDAADKGFDGVFARADAALYEAKRTGRDRAVLAPPPGEATPPEPGRE